MVDCLLRVEPTGFDNSLVTENQERKRRRGGATGVSLSVQVVLEVKFVLFAEAVNVERDRLVRTRS